MTVNRTNVETWKRRFLRKYTASGVVDYTGLATLSDTIADEAGELVSITQSNIEGGSGVGVVTGNKMEMLQAVEELLGTDPATLAPLRSRVLIPDFRFCTP